MLTLQCVTNHPDNTCVNCKDNGNECQFDAKDGRKERASAKAVTESLTKRVHQLEELLRATQHIGTDPGVPPRENYTNGIATTDDALSTPDSRQSSFLSVPMSMSLSMQMLDDSATTTAAEAYEKKAQARTAISAITATSPIPSQTSQPSPAISNSASLSSPTSNSASASASATASVPASAASISAGIATIAAISKSAPTTTEQTSTSASNNQPDGTRLADITTIPTIVPPPSSVKDAGTPDTTTDTASVVRSLVPSPIRFDMSSGRVRYFGPTTNMNVLTHIPPNADGQGTDGQQLRRTPSGGIMGRRQPENHWPICLVVRDLSAAAHDYLMDQYWTCYNSVLHLVHLDAFNHDLERGGTQFYSLFLHLAMLATGFRFADKTRTDVQRLAVAPGGRFGSTLHEKAVALAKLEFDRPGGIPSIQAFGLLADVEFNIGRDESGWLFAGMSLRLVIDVGLHVDPSPLQLTVKEAQIRHMVLWACILHDMYWSLYLGRPTTLKAVDIAPACLSKDFTRLICCRPSGHEKKLTTRIYEHLLQLMDLISPLCDRSTLARPSRTTETYFKMVALDEDLHGWYDDLPEDLKWPTTRPNMPSSYYLLHTQYHAALILLHRPFVQYQQGAPTGTGGPGPGTGTGAGARATSTSGNTNPEEDPEPGAQSAGNRNRFSNLSRSVCAEHAGHIVALFQEYRAQFDVSRVFGTGLSHLGTAATTLMGEAVLEMDRAKRGVVIVQLMSVRRSINLMSGNYPPGHHMTRILDEFIQAIKQQQREGTTPPQSCGPGGSLSLGQDMALDPALAGVQGGDLRRVSFMNDGSHNSGNSKAVNQHPSSVGPDGSLLVPQHQQQPTHMQQTYGRQANSSKHLITLALDDINLNAQLQGDLYYQGSHHNYNGNYLQTPNQGGVHGGNSNNNDNNNKNNTQARKRQRIGNPCTFTPTVPASPTLQGLPFVPSSFLESLEASDLVVFPETAGYSDYGFEWDPADMTPI
ncbi:hypothetical protein Sste5346_001683 [Sporothrix stenoceras]|uniref:Xylanolytic transcriptional activator regulatory domain-containing protein n=1 Tax=Sporothrix stenoceras TaxID=5173 RepID=A0ABR3ZP81_9PEZI